MFSILSYWIDIYSIQNLGQTFFRHGLSKKLFEHVTSSRLRIFRAVSVCFARANLKLCLHV